tara:strand:+ start:81 stop:260 length:180 start_codon:yes stop_codon:yes gene_type:complete
LDKPTIKRRSKMDYEAKIKELTDNAEKFKNAYVKTMGALEFLMAEQAKEEEKKEEKKDK